MAIDNNPDYAWNNWQDENSDLRRYKEDQKNRKESLDEFLIQYKNDKAYTDSQFDRLSPEALERISSTHELNYYNPNDPKMIRTFDLVGSSFGQDVSDEYSLSYLGQIGLYQQLMKDNDYLKDGYDSNFDPFLDENISGYEQYASKFQGVINKKHMDIIKKVIDANTNTRARLNRSDRWFFPALLSGTLDPVNLITLNPVLKGATSFKSRFVRGGGAVTGIIAPTEAVRATIDPTSSLAEVGMNLGTSFLIGGFLTGTLGKSVNENIYNDTIVNRGGYKGLANNYNSAQVWHGSKMSDFDWSYDPKQDIPNLDADRIITYGRSKKAVEVIPEKTNQRPKIKINRRILEAKWKTKPKWFKEQVGNFNNFEKLEIKRAVDRDVYLIKRGANETIRQYDKRLDNLAFTAFNTNKVDRNTETGMFGRFVEKFTNYGQLFNNKTIKNKELRAFLQDNMFALTGDYATRSVAARAGKAFNGSVALDVHIKWDNKLRRLTQALDDGFVAFRKTVVEEEKTDSQTFLTYNLTKQRLRAGDLYQTLTSKIGGNKKNPDKLHWDQYKDVVMRGVVDEDFYKSMPDIQKEAVDQIREITSLFHEANQKYGLYANANTLRAKKIEYNAYIVQVDELIATTKNEIKIREYKKVKEDLQGKIKGIDAYYDQQDAFFKLDTFEPDAKTYLPIIYDKDAIMKNKTAFVEWLAGKFNEAKYKKYTVNKETGELTPFANTYEARKKRAEQYVDRLLNEDVDDFDGIMGKGRDAKGRLRYGVSPFKRRTLNFDHKEFLKDNNGIADFVVTDVEYLMRQYISREAKAIETAARFGDPHLEKFTIESKLRFIKDEIANENDVTEMNRTINLFLDENDKMRGTLSLEDPSSINKRTAGFLRDWASLAMMGKVVLSATVDVARPMMVNGFRRTFSTGFNQFMTNQEGFFRSVENLRYMGVALEVTLGMARKRFIEDGGQIGRANSTLGRWFDRQADRLNNAQAPFYTLNGLTPWTQMMKDLQGVISSHRFLEDSQKWARGELSDRDQLRLVSYGIDERTAKLIAQMPYEDVDGLLTANAEEWLTINGGETASRKFKEALYADINRTIITPSSADQLNMMHGVVRINDPKYANFFANSSIAEFFGYKTTEYGGQFSNAWLGLPFQFMSWGIAANRKLLVSGLQGRDESAMMGIIAMITMGAIADRLKNKQYWQNKPTEEKIIRAVEQSGVLGLFGDMNFMMETMSSGFFGQSVGLRPMVGVPPRFGESNIVDATGEVVGVGPSILLDLGYAFGSDSTYNERASTIRRLIPLGNLWLWDEKFKSIYNSTADMFRPEE